MFALLKFIVAVVLVQQVVSFQQHEYRIIHEKVVIEDYNPKYMENPIVTLFKYNETSAAFNGTGTLKASLSNDIWVHMKIFQSVDGGEFRVYPAKFSLNLCEAQRKDTFGTRDIYQYGNITDCPIKAGFYYVSNYKPDESKFPTYVPRGKLVIEAKTYDRDIYLATSRWYGTVENVSNDM